MGEPRVLLVTKGLDLGGSERIVADLAIGLTQRGVPVDVAVVNPNRDRLVPSIEAAGVPVHRLGGSDQVGLGAARRLVGLVRSGRYDVIHVHNPLLAPLVRLAGRRVAVITTSHNVWPSFHPLTRAAWRATAGHDDAVIAVSAVAAATLPSRARERSVVLPYGIDPTRIEAALEAATTDRQDGRMAAIVVASHRDGKNYRNLLQGVRVAVDIGAEFTVACVGEGDCLADHQALAHTLGLDDVVTFEAPTENILERMAAADVLVVASDYEGQPIVVAEALALHKPVIATAVGRVPEMVNSAVGRVVPPRDPETLGAALAELANSLETRAAMALAATDQPVAWSIGDVLDAHLALYVKVSSQTSSTEGSARGS